MMENSLLSVRDINSYYGLSHVLQGVTLYLNRGELVSILGRNGAGKTTTLKSIMGMVEVKTGEMEFCGKDLRDLETHEIAAAGICYVPENRGIFKVLSVEENLRLALRGKNRRTAALDPIYQMFPRLKERRRNGGGELSGGEQQMLAIARALLNSPKLLMLDEPTEGLAPVIVDEIVEQLVRIKKEGMTVLMVEQNLKVCTTLADRHYILDSGRLIYGGSNEELLKDYESVQKILGVEGY